MFLRVKSHAWKLHHSTGRYLPERGQFASQEARLRSWMSELHRRSFEFFKGSSHRNDANRTVSDWIREYKIHRADKALEVRTPIEFFTKGGDSLMPKCLAIREKYCRAFGLLAVGIMNLLDRLGGKTPLLMSGKIQTGKTWEQ